MGCCCSSSDSQDITVPDRPGPPEDAPTGVPYGLQDNSGNDNSGATGYNVNG
ncbi:hypothetical protein CpipJ_CPIJ017176 [Culex quinquefasciatus]|uniref:Uncharacterized protein n=1 Tax=Culex quinquefasciatus TaxID=7176 RepID=B0XCT9_CULQU|nr:hypothetical protein CpipJ_CPIJ017176 [Culex quinquefasciatus]|eukprot:XP_001867461.1 hypothetical protein CpipJ_CPIJ017176 [Culex quinquefasciatus]